MSQAGSIVDSLLREWIDRGGPGAAVAVVKQGEVVHRQGYGLANRAENIPMSPATAFRICSVTKQFTCLLIRLLEHEGRLDLAHSPRRYLPELPAFMEAVSIRQLCQNVSGLRDYWCLAMLAGAGAETRFRRPDAERILFGQRDFQFAPGTAYSYCNGNFTVLGWVIEAVTGRPYPQVLAARILEPLGMEETFVPESTSEPLPGGSLGYEPAPGGGDAPAVVDIHWEGDAGIVSTLDDLVRWERNFDHNRIGPPALIEGLYETPSLAGGIGSDYGFGLHVGAYRGFPCQSHEGGLRGWRMCRARFPTERLSVIALFNNLAEAGDLARRVADAYLPGEPRRPRRPFEPPDDDAAIECCGFYLDRDTGKGFEILVEDGALTLNAMGHKTGLIADGACSYVCRGGDVRLTFVSHDVPVVEIRDFRANYRAQLARSRLDPSVHDPRPYLGRFQCAELHSTIELDRDGDAVLARVKGPLGEVEGWPLRPVSEDVLLMECQRSLDYKPPGAFVLWLRRDPGGRASELTASCGLAFGTRFERV